MPTALDVFLECDAAVRRGTLIRREAVRDKEFHFQNWFKARLENLGLQFDEPGRNTYPDFTLVQFADGYEVKGLAFPGREANYDCNSQMPTGIHRGRAIYYVFGRYPADAGQPDYPVYDLVICHGDFLNADHDYEHENKNIKGFGTYGDIMIRDRKMYVAPTPFALTSGTAREITLILPHSEAVDRRVVSVGQMTRVECENLVVGYTADLIENTLEPRMIKNPHAGAEHRFVAYRNAQHPGPKTELLTTAIENDRGCQIDD